MSPYGVDKKLGGDNKKNDSWMESCVTSVMNKQKKPKSSAIAICKAQMKRKNESKSNLNEDEIKIDQDIIGREDIQRHQYIGKAMSDGKSFEQALSDYEATLAKHNFEFFL